MYVCLYVWQDGVYDRSVYQASGLKAVGFEGIGRYRGFIVHNAFGSYARPYGCWVSLTIRVSGYGFRDYGKLQPQTLNHTVHTPSYKA